MIVEYRGQIFDLQPTRGGQLFARSGNCDLAISPAMVKDFVERGIMRYTVTTGKDEYDPGEVIASECGACGTKFEGEQRPTRKCTACGKLGCPECEHQLAFTQCDICDEDLCSECRRTVYGSSVICLKPECRSAALEGMHNAQLAAAGQRGRDRAAFFSRRSA